MINLYRRILHPFITSLSAFALIAPAFAQTAAPVAIPPAIPKPQQDQVPWLYVGSDIPVDKSWSFGVLPNGLRYALRRNGVPPQQVSIRVAIDAGSMMERENEQGYAHFIEHLSFRGSRHVTDGEAKRVWQRLGATFGSDTNATTSPTQTVYKLDLPSVTPQGLEESLKILSGMMSGPTITQAEVDAERRTVLAELRESDGPGRRTSDIVRGLFFAGQPLGNRAPIGTIATLNAATPATVRAFHDRWYRPNKTVVSISGDVDPKQVEALLKTHFGPWTNTTPDPGEANFGEPKPDFPASKMSVEAGLPTSVTLGWMRPWKPRLDTIAYNQGKLVDILAARLISRRLEQRARAGGSFLAASVGQDDVSRSVDSTFVSITPIGNDWKAALADVRAVIADAILNPPTQEEIDREANEVTASLDVAVETSRAEPSAGQADSIVQAVDIRETVASPEVARQVFGGMQGKVKPADVTKSTQRLFSGVGPRAFVSSQTPVTNGDAQVAAALALPADPSKIKRSTITASFDQLPKLGTPATVTGKRTVDQIGLQIVTLSNGTRLVLNPTTAEAGRIYVLARFGNGRMAVAPSKPNLLWSGPMALIPSGVGTLKQDAIDKMTTGRQISMTFDVDDDAFSLKATTRAADLSDQLRLMATKLAKPGWDPAPLTRVKAALNIGLTTQNASPQAVIGTEIPALLRGGDNRWATPGKADIAALTPQSFRSFWEPLLTKGVIELSIYGDFEADKAIDAAAKSFGALPVRAAAVPALANAISRGPAPSATIKTYTHKGQADQAAAVMAWSTGGGPDGVAEGRQLDILAAIFNDRMFEQFREAEGASYSPDVSSSWPDATKGGGSFTVVSQVKPEASDAFFKRVEAIAADLVVKPVTDDEMKRAVGPMKQSLARASSGNSFWMNQLSGISFDPQKLNRLMRWYGDIEATTPATLQQLAAKYLAKDKAMRVVVKPVAAK
jgi:zinc protease